MRLALTVQVPLIATSLFDLIGNQTPQCSKILMQADQANAARVFFGNPSHQPFSVNADGSVDVATNSLKCIFVKGAVGDLLHVGVL